MTDPIGPLFAAGNEIITTGGYQIVFLPDVHNEQLQNEGKPPTFYWLPNTVRLATKQNGDFKFHFTHFYGKRGTGTTIGVAGDDEVAGGLLSFSTTCSFPPEVMAEAQRIMTERAQGSQQPFWRLLRGAVTPNFRPAPIVSNWTSITNLAPLPDGSVPSPSSAPNGSQPTPVPGGPTPVSEGSAGPNPGSPPGGAAGPPSRELMTRGLRSLTTTLAPRGSQHRGVVTRDGAKRRSNLDQWFFQVQGQGSGSINPNAENAYSALVGSLPGALVWAGFHGSSSTINVWQTMKLKVWTPQIHLKVEAEWKKVQDHFSANAKFGGWFYDADVKAEFNSLQSSGAIKVTMEIDQTIPGADKIAEQLQKRSDLVYTSFMDLAKKMIFDAQPFTEKPAEASKGGMFGWGGGVALKFRRDTVELKSVYEETRQIAYLQDYPISGQLDGIAEAIKADAANEKKYFTNIYLEDWERKLVRNVKPVVNWPDPATKWIGEPVAFLDVQIGYPNTKGELQWDGHIFQSTEPASAVWTFAAAQKPTSDVANPPPGWEPDKAFIKRTVQLQEPPSPAQFPFARVQIETNTVELDPGPRGSLSSDLNEDIRVDNVGMLRLGPIFLNGELENSKQRIEVEFKATGNTLAGQERESVVHSWGFNDQEEPRFWMVFTGDPTYIPKYQYRVRCFQKGTMFSKGEAWEGPWQDGGGSGPAMISIPMKTDAGVVVRAMPLGAGTTMAGGTPPPRAVRPGGSMTYAGSSTAASSTTGAPPPRGSGPRSADEANGDLRDDEYVVVLTNPSTEQSSTKRRSRSANSPADNPDHIESVLHV